MRARIDPSDVAALPLDQRIELVEAIWDSIASEAELVPMPNWHVRELDKRSTSHAADPAGGTPWTEIRQRLLDSLKP
jgi:putative addiction module component (TIGR02574 family)